MTTTMTISITTLLIICYEYVFSVIALHYCFVVTVMITIIILVVTVSKP